MKRQRAGVLHGPETAPERCAYGTLSWIDLTVGARQETGNWADPEFGRMGDRVNVQKRDGTFLERHDITMMARFLRWKKFSDYCAGWVGDFR